MKKKILSLILIAVTALGLLTACGGDMSDINTDGTLRIVCTTFPQYDWVRELTKGAENVEIELLLDSGTDLHSYQPGAKDIVKITSADLFIYTGGTSEAWVEDVLKSSQADNILIIPLMNLLPEENRYCVEAIGEEEHKHEDGEEHNHAEDEHIWLSLKNAVTFVTAINTALCELDADNRAIYTENYMNYKASLEELDYQYKKTLAACSKDTLVFADRFPFIYLLKDYHLSYHAAFSGCSAESEASFETVKSLAGKIDELGLSHIIITETSDGSVANTVKDSTKDKNQEILILNAMQSVTKDKLSTSYLEVMKNNLEVIKTALS